MRENLNAREVRISDSPKPADGTYVLRAANDESAVCVLVVKDGRLEIWLKLGEDR